MSKVILKVEIDEEAYKQINGDSVCSNNNECIISKSSSAYYALNAIINATPITESDDVVSRAEVCSIANGLKDYCVSMYNPNDASEAEIINYIYKYVDALYDLPSVTPKRERGEWICDDFIESIYHCSLCQGKIKGKLSKYCPNCGAEMR